MTETKRISWIREAVNTISIRRSGRPFVDLVRACGALGSTVAETAGVMECYVEHVIDVVEGYECVSPRQADRLLQYVNVLWWYHCFRDNRPASRTDPYLDQVRRDGSKIWAELPAEIRNDWIKAKQLAGMEADNGA